MLKSRLIVLAVLVSASSFDTFARVSFQEKQLRVASLLKLQSHNPLLAFEAYKRELNYEAKGLTINNRAKNETNLLADKIRYQVTKAYKAALSNKNNSELAREEIRTNIEKDLELAAPELKEELLSLAMKTLDSIDNGGSSEEIELSNIEIEMKKEVLKRANFLNQEDEEIVLPPTQIKSNSSFDADKKNYLSTSELLASLVSDQANTRLISSSNQTIKTANIIRHDTSVSLQVKFEFLGAAVEAGPQISFKRQYTTNALIKAEGLNPVVLNNGNFDFSKRDTSGKIIIENGIEKKRSISFACSAELEFSTDYSGAGGFKFMDVGLESSIQNVSTNNVTLTSRIISLPESVANKILSVKYLSELCHNHFLETKFNNNMNVSSSLNIMMKNVVAGLTFSHPKTKCAVDTQCYDWFNDEVITFMKGKNFPRCTETNGSEKFRVCRLRGLEGQNCPVYEDGKLTSSGKYEFSCDNGLKCVKYENQTFFLGAIWTPSKGKCQVINKATYRNPFELANEGR